MIGDSIRYQNCYISGRMEGFSLVEKKDGIYEKNHFSFLANGFSFEVISS